VGDLDPGELGITPEDFGQRLLQAKQGELWLLQSITRSTTYRPPRRKRKRLDPLIPFFQNRSFIPPETPLPCRTRSQKDPLGRPNFVRPFGHEPLDLFL
jgi:hypothetical protein